MTTVLIVRHGLTASTGKALTGWLPGIGLDDRGRQQAATVAGRLAGLRLAAIVSSPLERCQQTAEIISAGQASASAASNGQASAGPASNGQASDGQAGEGGRVAVQTDERLGECRYGDWT